MYIGVYNSTDISRLCTFLHMEHIHGSGRISLKVQRQMSRRHKFKNKKEYMHKHINILIKNVFHTVGYKIWYIVTYVCMQVCRGGYA